MDTETKSTKKDRSSNRIVWILAIIPLLAVLLWNIISGVRTSSLGSFGIGSILGSLSLLALSFKYMRTQSRSLALIVILSGGVAIMFWLMVLDLILHRTTIFAVMLLGLISAGLLHAIFLFISFSPSESLTYRRIRDFGFTLAVVFIFLTAAEGVVGAISPGKIHAPVPDREEMGSHLKLAPDGRFVGNPEFRGEFIHPEFAGIRVEINEYGLRDDPGEASPPDSQDVSILVLGDSFAFGTGVSLEDTFQEQLEKNAKQITEKPLRVYGAGIPGYGTYQEWQMLRELIPTTRPDVVIVAVFEENDFLDNWAAVQRAKNKSESSNGEAQSHPADSGSKLGSFIRSVFSGSFWLGTSSIIQLCQARLDPLLFKLGLLKSVSFDFFQDLVLSTNPPEMVSEARTLVVEKLLDIRQECEAISSKLVVLVIPSIVQVKPERFASFLSLKAEEERAQFTRTAFHNRFIEDLSSRQFVVVDMLPALEKYEASGNPCYHNEGHWNSQGHALASTKLIPVLYELLN